MGFALPHQARNFATAPLPGGAGETTEKLEAEFGERLQRLGPIASPAALHALLVDTVSMRAPAPHIPSAARTAHLLITAALNLTRVEVAPLPDEATLSPLAPLLAQQQVRNCGLL